MYKAFKALENQYKISVLLITLSSLSLIGSFFSLILQEPLSDRFYYENVASKYLDLSARYAVAADNNIIPGDLIKASTRAVYFVGNDFKRYVFPNSKTFYTWHADFSSVKVITDAELATFPLGSNITYRPGIQLIKIESANEVYAVDNGAYLRWVPTEAMAIGLYGADWNKQIDDVPVVFWPDYTLGPPLEDIADFDRQQVLSGSPDIITDWLSWKVPRQKVKTNPNIFPVGIVNLSAGGGGGGGGGPAPKPHPVQIPGPNCGDGKQVSREECDGSDLGSGQCTNQGFDGGTLSCNSNCTFDTTSCTTIIPTPTLGDTTPPVLSNIIISNLTDTKATISWTTNEVTIGEVSYSTDLVNFFIESSTGSYVTTHSLALNLLTQNTLYYYQVVSEDAAGNTTVNPINIFNTKPSVVADTTPPVTTASPQGGTFTTAQSINLSRNELGVTYYTTNGATPNTTSVVYTNSISLSGNTTLKFFSIDNAGNIETVKTQVYTITTGPICGNNTKESGEMCDGFDLASQSCSTQGFASGTLACATNCQSFNISSCVANTPPRVVCGNGTVETGEACDDGNTTSGDGCSSSCMVEVTISSSSRGYQPRGCGLNMDRDNTIGEVADCNVCNANIQGGVISGGGTIAGATQRYVSCGAGSDVSGCGLPGKIPCNSLKYAMNAPGSNGYNITCFTGTCNEGDFTLNNGGNAIYHTVAPTGNQVRSFRYPSAPAMLIGWDRDQDSKFPPFDKDDTSVLNGDDSYHQFIGGGSVPQYVEFAHFTAQNYGDDELLSGANNRGIVTTVGSYNYFHDLELHSVNNNSCMHSGSITFPFWQTPQHVAIQNIYLSANGGYFIRGAGSASIAGPTRVQNITRIARGIEEGAVCGSGGGHTAFWKFWSEGSGFEIMDNRLECDIDNWNGRPPVRGCLGINPAQCSQDYDIVNNEFINMGTAVDVQCTAGGSCQSQPVSDILIDRNFYLNTRGVDPGVDTSRTAITNIWESGNIFKIEAGDGNINGAQCKDVTISNNFATWVNTEFETAISYATTDNRTSAVPGTITIINNTFNGPLQDTNGPVIFTGTYPGYIAINRNSNTDGAAHDTFNIKNNIFSNTSGSGGCVNVQKSGFTSGGGQLIFSNNVHDPNCGWRWNGASISKNSYSTFQSLSGEKNSFQCTPTFVDVAAKNFHLANGDMCALNKGVDVTSVTSIDYDGNIRPSGSAWDIGADEYTGVASASICGNNIKETGETCDGTDLNNQSCTTQGFLSGTLTCSSNCLSFVTTQCSSTPPAPDTTNPTVTLTSPANGTMVSGNVTLAATATDNIGVAGVQFKVDGTNEGVEDTSSPYSVSWNTTLATDASHTISAIARDAAGNTATATFTVQVDNADHTNPTVTLTSPANGTMVSGNVTLAATATDNIGVAGVQFKVNGSNEGAEDTTSAYSVVWDTTAKTDGSYTISAVARDATGNTSTNTLTITINNTNPPAPSGLIGHWKLDDATGNVVVDSSGNGNNGTRVGNTTWVTGKIGGALDLAGTEDYVRITGSANGIFDLGLSDLSFGGWTKMIVSAETSHYIVNNGAHSSGVGGFSLYAKSNSIDCVIGTLSQSTRMIITSSVNVLDDSWHHVFCTMDRDGNGVLYVDGVAKTTTSITSFTNQSIDTNFDLTLGTLSQYPGIGEVDGLIDDIRVYNKALTAQQVIDLYNL